MATVRKVKAKGLPKRYGKRTKAGYYTRAFVRAAEHKKRNVEREKRKMLRNRQSEGN